MVPSERSRPRPTHVHGALELYTSVRFGWRPPIPGGTSMRVVCISLPVNGLVSAEGARDCIPGLGGGAGAGAGSAVAAASAAANGDPPPAGGSGAVWA